MSIYDNWSRTAKENRENYPPGTRIELLCMTDPHHPVPSGTRGTVAHVDSAGQIHMRWDNGRTLALSSETDSFRKLTARELEAEQQTKKPALDDQIQNAASRAEAAKASPEVPAKEPGKNY